jgi:hypothetical protein
MAAEYSASDPPQHPLWLSVLLHLIPGATLLVFIVLAASPVKSLGFPVVFALFAGIAVVIVPIELGIILVAAWRKSGSFQLDSPIVYRERLPRRQLLGWVAGLTIWFLVFTIVSTVLLDEWLAETFF